MDNDILKVIEIALAVAGYKILDGGKEYIIIRHCGADKDYKITVEEEPC